jgi:hypothetical protein
LKRTKQTTDDFETWIDGVSMVALGEVKKSKG